MHELFHGREHCVALESVRWVSFFLFALIWKFCILFCAVLSLLNWTVIQFLIPSILFLSFSGHSPTRRIFELWTKRGSWISCWWIWHSWRTFARPNRLTVGPVFWVLTLCWVWVDQLTSLDAVMMSIGWAFLYLIYNIDTDQSCDEKMRCFPWVVLSCAF